ncbi:hypothetical protein pEaSNUABM11_00066 [Erwinia phage pEa_SNUABM_11]|nr:hypothetical protein pEaSNUABM11_00066 [Erwinia phage pEa_SNUABM_11]
MDFNNAEQVLKTYMGKLAENPILVHDDKLIHDTLPAVAVILARFRLCSSSAVQEVLYDEYPQIGFTFNQFYNETVAFVLDGKRRDMSVGQWSVLMQQYMNDVHGTKYVRQTGSLGSRMMAASFGDSGKVRNLGPSHQTLTPDTRLLSYADHELLAQWLTRVNGLSDMVSSLAVFLKIARP